MVSILSLWLPILVSAVLVFVVSSIVHMVLPYHKSDWKKISSEDEVRSSLGKLNIPPGEYMIPRGEGMESLKDPEFLKKYEEGPVALITVMKNGTPTMGSNLLQWFIYSIVVSIFAAYVAGRALSPESHYLAVFRFAGVTAFLGYGMALAQGSIWNSRPWPTTLKSMFDALLYGLVTAGTFGWLWP